MSNKTTLRCASALLTACMALCLTAPVDARPAAKSTDPSAVRDAAELATFEHKVALEKELGATQVLVTEGLPLAFWKLDKDDPYPDWFLHHADLMTVFPPKNVQPYVDMGYAAHVAAVVQKRCEILGKYGMTAVWAANEPAVVPEAFFTAHPELRGPRIDQANRSRKVYFAMNVDEPETLALYREAIQKLLQTCPQAETFNFVTTDAGSGFDWTQALYPGLNGNSNYRDKPLADRVAGFMINIQQAAKAAGHDIRININPIEPRQWMIPTFSPDVLENIVRKLPRGLAVEGREGPDGRPFATGASGGAGGVGNAFYPVIGIVAPAIDGGAGSGEGKPFGDAPTRLQINLGDDTTVAFNYRLLKAIKGLPMRTIAERVAALRGFAISEVGEAHADDLLEAWSALGDVKRNLDVLDFGGMLRFGDVLNRWIDRPMVPFPAELTPTEKKDYAAFLFQAKGDEQAQNLADIQAMRMYEGYGAKLLFQRDIETAMPRVQKALSLFATIRDAQTDPAKRDYWDLSAKRTQALIYLLQSADNNVAYQAQLDRVKRLGVKPEDNPVLGVQSSWDRTDLMETARKEIDTMVNLRRLLESSKAPILDLAATPEEETIMRLGPNLDAEIKDKIDIMNAHWRDYDRLFTVPNP